MTKILLSNDDGYLAPGLAALHARVSTFAETVVVAPDRNRSGASSSLTLEHPLRAYDGENGFIFVDGTPTDCVHIALTGMLDFEPDLVVSGINAGANIGDDVLYSGTVAAAMEGRHLGLPSIAVSLVSEMPTHYDTAAIMAERVIHAVLRHSPPTVAVLNVNVPDVPVADIRGIVVTRLGERHRAEAVVKDRDPRGRTIYWIGPAGDEQDAGPGTDFHAVRNNFVSITPLHVDLTQHQVRDELDGWLTRASE
ncbi:MAG: 5'/3'-nucleotidase SurE [Pseudomonadota bacterium]